MLDLGYDYQSCIRGSEKIAWKLDEVMPPEKRLDFQRPYLPDGLCAPTLPAFLTAKERLALNHINGNAYMNLFGFVEVFILAMAVQHAQAEMFGDPHAIRALLRFGDEEMKHQQLFARFNAAFNRDFGHPCEVLGAAAEVANIILSKSPLAVTMVTLHIELMTQQHYTESVKDNVALDGFFTSLLRFHWLEESQHARIDALELEKLAVGASADVIRTAFDDYIALIGAFDGLLKSQAEMDVRSLARVSGRTFNADETAEIVRAQHSGYRRTFLVMGMTNATFAEVLAKLSLDGAKRVAQAAGALT